MTYSSRAEQILAWSSAQFYMAEMAPKKFEPKWTAEQIEQAVAADEAMMRPFHTASEWKQATDALRCRLLTVPPSATR